MDGLTPQTLVSSPPQPRRSWRFGRFKLVGKLASGGMAEIYAGELNAAAGFRKRVAIKRMRPHLVDRPDYVRMFLDEARLGARLSHPKICEVYELAQVDGEYYISMEYLHGVTLSKLISTCSRRRQRLPVPIVAGIIAQACEALHYAHELRDDDGAPLGVIHRDVSPQNLFVRDDGVVKLLDFGIAKAVDSSHQTKAGTIKGKDRYMSPEQHQGKRLDRRTDIWSIGVVLFECLTGTKLFERPSLLETAQAIVNQPLPSLEQLRPDVPPALGEALSRALCRERQWRFATAEKLRVTMLDAMGAAGVAPPDTIGALVRSVCGADLARCDKLFDQSAVAEGGSRTGSGTSGSAPGERYDIAKLLPLRAATAVSSASRPAPPSAPVEPPPLEEEPNEPPATLIERPIAATPACPTGTAHSAPAPEQPRVHRSRGWFMVALAAGVAAVAAGMLLWQSQPTADAAAATRATDAPQRQRPVAIAAQLVAAQPSESPVEQLAPAPAPPADSAKDLRADTPAASTPAKSSTGRRAQPPRKPATAGKSRALDAVKKRKRAPVTAEPAAAPSPARPPPAAKPGSLFIDADPYATIYIDGKKLGVTPLLDEKVAAGTRTLRAVTADGRVKTLQLNVRPGKTVRRRITW